MGDLRARIALALAGLALATVLAGGCGSAEEPERIVLITSTRASLFDDAVACGAKAAARRLNVDLAVREPRRRDPVAQTAIVETVAQQHPDAVVIAPAGPRAMLVPLRHLTDAGVEVVVVGARLGPGTPAVSEIASDDLAGGAAAADAIERLAVGDADRRQRSEPYLGRVGMIGGGISPARSARLTEGFLAGHGRLSTRLRSFGVRLIGDDPATVTMAVLQLLEGELPLRFVLATDSRLAEAAAVALVQSSRPDVGAQVVSWGADRRNIANLRRGLVDVLFVERPWQIGARALEQAVRAARGELPEPAIMTDWSMVTRASPSDPATRRTMLPATC